jgi:tricorn protease
MAVNGPVGPPPVPQLGLELEEDSKAGRYRVRHVFRGGPADKDWVKVKAGDYLLSIDGTEVRSGDNYQRLMEGLLNDTAEIRFNHAPSEDGAWSERLRTVTPDAFQQLDYNRWVDERRAIVDRLSGGRVGYMHIRSMDAPSLKRFQTPLRDQRDKEAMIIDVRFNPGGNIEQELLASLIQRPYQLWQLRGAPAFTRPFSGFPGKMVVLQNEKSTSDAEMFAAGFKSLGLGKTVGTKTGGAVIWTWSDGLIDGSTLRRSSAGVFLMDPKRDMENLGVDPDVPVENSAEDELEGRDRQLERAVEALRAA